MNNEQLKALQYQTVLNWIEQDEEVNDYTPFNDCTEEEQEAICEEFVRDEYNEEVQDIDVADNCGIYENASEEMIKDRVKQNIKEIKELLKPYCGGTTVHDISEAYKLARYTNELFIGDFVDLPERLQFYKMARFYKRYIETTLEKQRRIVASGNDYKGYNQKATQDIKKLYF